jgi:iron complex transport system substrate-binding protein
MPGPAIVSLLPSATEIVCALGCRDRLKGRSHECDFPPEVQLLPVCTASKLRSETSSIDIDRQVKSISRTSSIYDIDASILERLRPKIILTQAQCEVCAVSLADVQNAAARWPASHRPEIVTLSPTRLADVWQDTQAVAQALGVPERGRELLSNLKTRVVDIIQKTCLLKRRPSVACIEWLDPLMAAGNWVPEMVEMAGGQNLLGQAAEHSNWLDWKTLGQADPDVIVAMPCGFDLPRTRQEMRTLNQRAEWRKLRAVKSRKVFLTDGSHFFNRPGPRLVDSLEILAEILHPRIFSFGHKGRGWETQSPYQ